MSSPPPPKRPRIDPPDADTVDGIVSDRPSSAANKTVVTSGSQPAERVNPVFGPGYATKFDNFSILPRIVREAVYSCVDWDTSRDLQSVILETEEYYARRPYKMEMVTMTYTPDYSYLPFTDVSAFVIDYRSGQDPTKMYHDPVIHTLGQQQFDYVPGYRSRFTNVMSLPKVNNRSIVRHHDKFFLHVHKWSYNTNHVYRNFRHVHAAAFCVHTSSFFGSTPSSQKSLRHRPSELCVIFDDVDVDFVNRILRLPIRRPGRRWELDMDEHKERVVAGTRDWLRYVQPTNGLVLIVNKAMTVPAGVFNLNEVKSANEIMIHSEDSRETTLLDLVKIDITMAQLLALNANCIRFEFETPSISVDQLLLFVMDKIKVVPLLGLLHEPIYGSSNGSFVLTMNNYDWRRSRSIDQLLEQLTFTLPFHAWLADPDPKRMYHFLFCATVTESKQLEFVTELSNLEMGVRFKTHWVSGGVWIRGDFMPIARASILEDTKFGRHLLISCGPENTVGIYPLYACEGYDDCQCVIGRGPCKAGEKE